MYSLMRVLLCVLDGSHVVKHSSRAIGSVSWSYWNKVSPSNVSRTALKRWILGSIGMKRGGVSTPPLLLGKEKGLVAFNHVVQLRDFTMPLVDKGVE